MSKKPNQKPGKNSKQISFLTKLEASQERNAFLENFSMLIGSGMDVLVALDASLAEARTPGMKQIISGIKSDIENGEPVWKAFQRTEFLPAHIISLIKIGEEAGRLPENLSVISIQQQKESSFRSKLFSAMLYPAIVFGVTIIVGILISWFILPRLATVFSQLNIDLPLVTKIVIGFGDFLSRYGFVAVPLAILAVLGLFYYLFIRPKSRVYGEKLLRFLPGAQRVVREIEVARLGYVLGTLLEAGLPVLEALRSVTDATPFVTYQQLYGHIYDKIEQGNSFRNSFKDFADIDKLLPVPIQQLVASSEQSGNLAKALLKIGQRYEDRIENTSKNLVVVLEPVLLVFVWLGVVAVAVAVILPIYSLVGQFNGSQTASSPPAPTQDLSAEDVKDLQNAPAPRSQDPAFTESENGQVAGAATGQGWIIMVGSEMVVSVKDRPAEAGQIIGNIKSGDSYFAAEKSNGWFKINFRGGVGWVSQQTVKVRDL
ncbi:type II secretion system F family protein [Candidatus Berkelbacteria bacterium]|nr:type II secretion system F family protein [Candidatus Berkelbacteria bacterium]